MQAELTQLKLPSQVTSDLAALEKRSGSFSSKSRKVFWLAALTILCASAAFVLAHWYAPNALLSGVEVPPELLELFSGEANASRPFVTFGEQLGSMTSAPLFKVISVFFLMVTIGVGILNQNFVPVIFGFSVFFANMFLTYLLPTSQGSGNSQRSAFVAMADGANYAGMREMLLEKNVPEHLKQYVLTQALLVQAKNDGKPLDDAAKQSLVAGVKGIGIAVDGGQFASASPQVLYALETKVLGQSTSTSAQAYFTNKSKANGWWSKVGVLFSGASLGSLLAGLGLLVIAHRLRARVARIGSLLGTSGSASAVHGITAAPSGKEQALTASGPSEKAQIFRGRVDLNTNSATQ